MLEPDVSSRGCPTLAQPLIEHDLCARLEPLDRYGLAEFSSAIVQGLLTLADRSKCAVRSIGRRKRR